MVVGDGEGHELVERHAVLGIDVEQGGRCGREAQALLDHLDRDEERCGDLLLGLALHPHILEGAELVQRMKRRAIDILDQRHFLGQDLVVALAHDARHGGDLGEALLLDQQLQRTEAAAAGRDLEHAGLLTFGVDHGHDAEALDQAATRDRGSQVLDRDAGLHTPDVGLAEHQLVEGDVA